MINWLKAFGYLRVFKSENKQEILELREILWKSVFHRIGFVRHQHARDEYSLLIELRVDTLLNVNCEKYLA